MIFSLFSVFSVVNHQTWRFPTVTDLPLLSLPETTLPSTEKRRRGAPIGNTNALKHGFYSRSFRDIDLHDLDKIHFSGLQDEITMLRVYIRRVTEMSDLVVTFADAVALLRVLSLASISLTRLLATQSLIHDKSGQDDPDTSAAAAGLAEDLLAGLPLIQPPES